MIADRTDAEREFLSVPSLSLRITFSRLPGPCCPAAFFGK